MSLKSATIPVTICAGLLIAGGAALAQSPCGLFEAVEPGDTFELVAQRCGIAVETLIAANPGIDAAAPEVATTIALVLPEGAEVAGEPASPGRRILQAPETGTAPGAQAPEAQVVIVATDPPAPPAEDNLDAKVLQPVFGQWIPPGGICADPETVWTIEDERLSVGGDVCAIENTVLTGETYVLKTVCGGSGIVTARDFVLRPLDALTLGFVTGDQEGVLTRCAPG